MSAKRGKVTWVGVSDFRGTNPKSFAEHESSLSDISQLIETLGFSVGNSRIRSYQNVLSALRTKAERDHKLTLSDGMQLLHTSVELHQLGTILRAARGAPDLSIWQSHLERLISGTHPDVPAKLSPTWDFQFETFVASVAQLSGYEIDFQEPDILIKDGDRSFGIAAKRPRTAPGLRRNLQKAAKQILKSTFEGMIAVDCSVILATDRAITTTSDEHAAEFVEEILADFLRDSAFEIHRYRSEPKVFAMLFVLHMPVTIVDTEWTKAKQLTTAFRWTVVPLVNPDDPRYHTSIRFAERCSQGLFTNRS
ncbi:MAG: hypothetical protein JHD07_17850 [Bradyrhizobium sp.]|uniref:hypothetical protein n=1 Tax=Bradyrhizobium sp. TaxID=376 RepID=UPI001A256412|nr:hypothetical protein [Bradyrhizobium sp.]MBJ7405063.1 hypothetical protein [Bradyrhizobium sp.]